MKLAAIGFNMADDTVMKAEGDNTCMYKCPSHPHTHKH